MVNVQEALLERILPFVVDTPSLTRRNLPETRHGAESILETGS